MSLSAFAQPAIVRDEPVAAIRHLRAEESDGASQEVLIRLALAYADMRQFRLFEQTMKEAIAMDAGNYAPYYYLGRYQQTARDDFPLAAGYFQEALRRKPDDFRSLYYLGLDDEKAHRDSAAEQQFQRAVSLAERRHVSFSLPYQGLARLRLSAGEPETALPFARRAVETGPEDPSSYRVLAKCLEQLDRGTAAIEAWQNVVRLDGSDAPAAYSLYRAQMSAGHQSEAAVTLKLYKRVVAAYGSQ